MTKPIRIRSTSEYLELYVNLELLLSDLYMPSYSAQAIGSWLKFWSAQKPNVKKHLNVFYRDTQDGSGLKTFTYHKMHVAATSLGWTVGKSEYQEIRSLKDAIWR